MWSTLYTSFSVKGLEDFHHKTSQSHFVRILGLLTATSTVYSLVHGMTRYLTVPKLLTGTGNAFTRFGSYQNAYVIITGASDGIGKAIAFQSAAKGFHVILLSRNMTKLQEVCIELQKKYPGTKVVLFAMDCSDQSQLFLKLHDFLTLIQGLDIAMLWNNVAITTDTPVAIEHLTEEEILRIQTTNTTFLVALTSRIIPLMRSRQNHNKQCVIVNISSFLSILPAANFVLYSATKAFVNQFSIALQCELDGSNIDVIAFRPAHVATKMSKIETTSWMVPSPETWAIAAWKKLENAHHEDVVFAPYFPHAIQEWFANQVPSWFIRSSLRAVLIEPEERKQGVSYVEKK